MPTTSAAGLKGINRDYANNDNNHGEITDGLEWISSYDWGFSNTSSLGILPGTNG